MTEVVHFADRCVAAICLKRTLLFLGIDPRIEQLPKHLLLQALAKYGRTDKALMEAVFLFYAPLIDALVPFVIGVKPNIAFFEWYGSEGLFCYQRLLGIARSRGLILICDGKRGDGDETAGAYADGHIGEVLTWGKGDNALDFSRTVGPIRVDALTIETYIGNPCLTQYWRRVKAHGTGVFAVTRTSFNPPSEVQEWLLEGELPVWKRIGMMVGKLADEDTIGASGFSNMGVVLGATRDEDGAELRGILPHSFFLVPGYGGPQQGSAQGAIAGTDYRGLGCVVNMSRGSTRGCVGEDFVEVAINNTRSGRDALNEALRKVGKDPYD